MNIKKIAEVIKDLNNIDIFENTRRRDVIEMRAVANKYMREYGKMRLMQIVKAYEENNFKTSHCSVIYSLNTYEQHAKYNKNIELTMKALLGDNKLFVIEMIHKANDEKIEQIEEILLQ